MISKATLKYVHSLKQKKYRQKYKKFTLESEKILIELLNQGIIDWELILVSPEKMDLFKNFSAPLEQISSKEMQKLSTFKTSQGIIAVGSIPKEPELHSLTEKERISVFLDDISDPGNLGTMLRTCEWFGIRNVFLTKNTVETWNPKVLHSSMGSFARVNIFRMEFNRIQPFFETADIVAADLNGSSIYDFKPAKQVLLVIGNESHGISPSILENCNVKLKIDSAITNQSESLNASTSLAIFASYFFEKFRI